MKVLCTVKYRQSAPTRVTAPPPPPPLFFPSERLVSFKRPPRPRQQLCQRMRNKLTESRFAKMSQKKATVVVHRGVQARVASLVSR